MDYYEFMERANTQVTEEEYAMIETIYLTNPDTVDVGDMVAWYKKYGMKGVKACYNMAYRKYQLETDYVNEVNKCARQEKQIAEYEAALAAKERTIRYLLGKLDTETILGDISKEALADLIANQEVRA